jgi:hypothetical protein
MNLFGFDFDLGIKRYYNLSRNWTRKIEPHLNDPKLNRILVRDFNRYTWGRWGMQFKFGDYPSDFESWDWRLFHRGKQPRFWKYVKQAASYWLANFALRLAMLAVPKRHWRIISSDRHSTVWDGNKTLFDFNFQGLGIDPDECFAKAMDKEYQPGKYMPTYLAEHYSVHSPDQLTNGMADDLRQTSATPQNNTFKLIFD